MIYIYADTTLLSFFQPIQKAWAMITVKNETNSGQSRLLYWKPLGQHFSIWEVNLGDCDTRVEREQIQNSVKLKHANMKIFHNRQR